VQFFGSGFAETLLDSNVAYEAESISGVFSKYGLTGVLSDGTDITGTTLFVQNGTGAGFEFITAVPEPGIYVMLIAGLSLVLLMARRSKPTRLAIRVHRSTCHDRRAWYAPVSSHQQARSFHTAGAGFGPTAKPDLRNT
jgi:hypothetical protein